MIAVPSGITAVEKEPLKILPFVRVQESLLLGEPMAASIGAGLPIDEEYANMIVDIGGGTTEVAIISISGVSSKEVFVSVAMNWTKQLLLT